MTADSLRWIELLAIAMVVAIATRRLSLPYTVGLVLVGIGIALARVDIGGALTHDFIFYLILPPLLFEAALVLNGRELWENAGIVSVLASLGTVLAATLVAAGMSVVLHWPMQAALIFGALIAATDPVAVIAMFKDNGVGGRLRTLMESESLFNDAAAAVLFSLTLAFAIEGHVGPPAEIAPHLLMEIGGGVAVGAIVGFGAVAIAWRSSEHIVEVALSVLAAYASFLIADKAGASGILATVVAGLVFGGFGLRGNAAVMTHKGKEFAVEFWDFAAFMANSAVFPLIGVAVGAMSLNGAALFSIGVAIVLALIGRAFTVYPLPALFNGTRQRLPRAYQHVLWWGGLRGALALALALSLPDTLPFRQEIELTTFGVVTFSIVIQGLSMPWLLRRVGIVQASPTA